MLHRDRVDEAVLELDVGVVGRELGDDARARAARCRARSPCRPRAAGRCGRGRARMRAARGARSARVVLERVEDGAVVANAARAVVEAADELAHDQQVDPVGDRRAQVREDVELAADADSPASGRTGEPSHFGPPTAPSSTASAARQAASVSGGQRVADRVDRGAAERVLLDVDLERQRLSTCTAYGHHLGPDPVAGQADDAARHVRAPRLVRSSTKRTSSASAVVGQRARRCRARAARPSRPRGRDRRIGIPFASLCSKICRATSSRRLTAATSARSTP